MNIQKKNIKIIRKISREIVPLSSIKTKVISSKKNNLLDKALLKEMSDVSNY
ncbi:MAG: hypothetical protein HQK91_13950 [Nitrospirae bacterium]|nr:hypothetical protein [Nitrospirota bacterium]